MDLYRIRLTDTKGRLVYAGVNKETTLQQLEEFALKKKLAGVVDGKTKFCINGKEVSDASLSLAQLGLTK